MMSLFSSFDLYFFPLSLLIMSMSMFLFFNFYVLNVKYLSLNYIFSAFESSFSVLKFKSMNLMILTFFEATIFMMLLVNFISVLMFNFALTSQVSLVMLLSFNFWISFMLFYLGSNMKGFISHCVPEGSPLYLVVFLFLIETVSILIRPITLMVRLTANILSGHLLMILLSKLVLSYSTILPIYIGLNVVEMFVAFIQAYIFMTMICLYYAEVN